MHALASPRNGASRGLLQVHCDELAALRHAVGCMLACIIMLWAYKDMDKRYACSEIFHWGRRSRTIFCMMTKTPAVMTTTDQMCTPLQHHQQIRVQAVWALMRVCMPSHALVIDAMQADTEDLATLLGIQDTGQTGQAQSTPVIGEQRKRTSRRLKAYRK